VIDPAWENPTTAADVAALRHFLSASLNDPLESLRQKKQIGQSLDAKAVLSGSSKNPEFARLQKYAADLPELFILSQVTLMEVTESDRIDVQVAHADGVRCPRSWRWVPQLIETSEWGPVSPRCAAVLAELSKSK